MAKCKDCIHFPVCEPHTDPNESYPEVGGCPAFKNKDAFVEVVRCKDCKKRYTENCFMQITRYPVDMDSNPEGISVEWTEDNDFCSYGERREGE